MGQSPGPWLKERHHWAVVRPPELAVPGWEAGAGVRPPVWAHTGCCTSQSRRPVLSRVNAVECQGMEPTCFQLGFPAAASSALQLAADLRLCPPSSSLPMGRWPTEESRGEGQQRGAPIRGPPEGMRRDHL